MGKLLTTGLTSLLLLIALMFIGITVASVITGQIIENPSNQDFEQMTEKTIDEISSYILIKDKKGIFSEINGLPYHCRLSRFIAGYSIKKPIKFEWLLVKIHSLPNFQA